MLKAGLKINKVKQTREYIFSSLKGILTLALLYGDIYVKP